MNDNQQNQNLVTNDDIELSRAIFQLMQKMRYTAMKEDLDISHDALFSVSSQIIINREMKEQNRLITMGLAISEGNPSALEAIAVQLGYDWLKSKPNPTITDKLEEISATIFDHD